MQRENVADAGHFSHRLEISNVPSVIERRLLQFPILLAVALGLLLMGGRFVMVLKESLKQSPDNWQGVALLAVMIGSASALIVLACAFAGALIGLCLRACFIKVASNRH